MSGSITIDGGGSGSRARLRGADGSVSVSGPPLSLTTVDVQTVIGRILALIDELPQRAGLEAISVGLAGALNVERAAAVRAALAARFPEARTAVARDIDLLVGQLSRPGAAVVVGTGVAVIAPTRDGEVLIDGRGFALGDRGGAGWIGLEALRRGLRDLDRDGRERPLLTVLRASLGFPPDRALASAVSAGAGLNQRLVARLAPTVIALAEQGDSDAVAVVAAAVDAVRESAGWALERARMASGAEIIVAGGLAGSGYFWTRLHPLLLASGRVEVVRRVDPLDATLV